DKARDVLGDGLGHVTRVSGASDLGAEAAARLANQIQRFLLDETRLGIPAIVHEEICSGLMSRFAVVYPQAIGVAATWDPDLARDMADAVRVQMRAMGAHHGLSPVLDVARDPRWGRTEETFGEDPYLVARMGVAFVEGLQGDDLTEGVVATAKHFVGYSASEGGLNWAPPHLPARELREVYLHPFEAVVDAGAWSVMNAYHELDGIPCGADRDLLTVLLRERWGFEGTVVSDYFAVRQLASYHHVAPDAIGAAATALHAGIDVELPGTDCYGEPLIEGVRNGGIDLDLVDTAVRRVLRSKFDLGLFESPFVDPPMTHADPGPERDLARRIATKSIVLLANDGVLPITPGSVSIAVIGPNAHDPRNLFGDYTYPAHIEALVDMQSSDNVFGVPFSGEVSLEGSMKQARSVFDALRDRLGDNVGYAPGCAVDSQSREGFEEAVALARQAGLAVMVMGDKAGLTSECTSGEGRDRLSLDLPGVQEDLVRAIIETGTPVVLILVTGRPCGSQWAHEHSSAVIQAWLPGEEGAEAIADVLTGVVSPGGKLPISHPRSAGQIPVYYGHKVSGGRSQWKGDYVDGAATPLYPFGHGLAYTTFRVSDLAVTPDVATWNGAVTVRALVTNTGDMDGDEVVQLYVRDPVASVTRPVLELKGFARVGLPARGSARVSFEVPVGQLGFYNRD
ncbi:MAG TPA: glycoside hydrolase family 3 N-terminal domain-containing protein, partial [Acidimicrobiia bacterium]|nr:glycoside hydrolase family 3 N-terminal domain-containing protein [Acidimicrobiia bacterium]